MCTSILLHIDTSCTYDIPERTANCPASLLHYSPLMWNFMRLSCYKLHTSHIRLWHDADCIRVDMTGYGNIYEWSLNSSRLTLNMAIHSSSWKVELYRQSIYGQYAGVSPPHLHMAVSKHCAGELDRRAYDLPLGKQIHHFCFTLALSLLDLCFRHSRCVKLHVLVMFWFRRF